MIGSIQAHEAGHWAVLRVLGSRRTVMGFSRELRLNAELNQVLQRGLNLERRCSNCPSSAAPQNR